MSLKVTEIQPTPNPNAVKFLMSGEISDRPVSFLSAAEGRDHPIASQLFSIDGVTSVLLLGDFVTVNKNHDADWGKIRQKVREILEKSR